MTDAHDDTWPLPGTLRWHRYKVVPPYCDDPQDRVTEVLRQPGFHDPSAVEMERVCATTWMRYHCLTHNQVWRHGGEHCPDHDHHEIALFCGIHGLETMWPQPLMMLNPGGFDPPLSARQLSAIDAAWNDGT